MDMNLFNDDPIESPVRLPQAVRRANDDATQLGYLVPNSLSRLLDVMIQF
jgi:hypothetical protein